MQPLQLSLFCRFPQIHLKQALIVSQPAELSLSGSAVFPGIGRSPVVGVGRNLITQALIKS